MSDKKKIMVLASGGGTNLQAIIDACESGVLPASVSHVMVNRKNVRAIERAQKHGIPCALFPWDRKKQTREEYDQDILGFVNSHVIDLIVLAGWMHLFTGEFLRSVRVPVINLHPAYPGEFPGRDAIEQAWAAYQKGKIRETGIMVHHVVERVDAGEVIKKTRIPIFVGDTLDSLRARITTHEKYLLIRGIEKLILSGKLDRKVYVGKVREVREISDSTLALIHSDRQSAFDRQICNIRGKGTVLTKIAQWWFERTDHIVPNHYIWSKDNVLVCRKAVPFKVEVVVRGYMTGSTSTSLWTHYQRGVREYCGHKIRDGYRKNQKLDRTIVTPTTKGKADELISGEDVVRLGLMTQDQWRYCHDKSLELFAYGQRVAEERGLLLIDTKFEFGLVNSQVTLIDEAMTVDSSRYWLLDSYLDRFDKGEEPEKFDKDVVREWIRARCDPYKEPIPVIPQELIDQAYQAYSKFYTILTGEELVINKDPNSDTIIDQYLEFSSQKTALTY